MLYCRCKASGTSGPDARNRCEARVSLFSLLARTKRGMSPDRPGELAKTAGDGPSLNRLSVARMCTGTQTYNG